VSVEELIAEITTFRDARDWKQFHVPEQLAAAIAIEAGELQEHFLWKRTEEVRQYLSDDSGRSAVGEEIADILIFCFLLVHELKLDPAEIVLKKLAANGDRYPIATSRGSSAKATRRPVD
jgi:NTP pyrophosphatase (non-canonical NTP hydrolase)